MRPTLEQIQSFKTHQSIMDHYKVCKKTVIRWLDFYGLNQKCNNFGRKLTKKDAKTIRNSYKLGENVKKLACNYKVTVSSIYRIINNETHVVKDCSKVSVIYNPKI